MLFSDLFLKYGLRFVGLLAALAMLWFLWKHVAYWWQRSRMKRHRQSLHKARVRARTPLPTEDLIVDCESNWAFPLPLPVVTEGVPEEPSQTFLEEPDPRLGAEATVQFPH